MKRLLILMTLLWVGWAGPVSADIYRWTDANGVMHFSNEPPPAGAKVLKKVEETPHDADADRQRTEAERSYLLEREKVEMEERKAGLPGRERAAQLKLEEADRRMQQAQQQQEQPLNKERGNDSGDAFLGYDDSGAGYGYSHGSGRPDHNHLDRGYDRKNNSLYYKDPHHPGPKPPPRPGAPASPPSKAEPKSNREHGYADDWQPDPNNLDREYDRKDNSLYNKDTPKPGPKPPPRPGAPASPPGNPRPK